MYASCRDELLEVLTNLVNRKHKNEFTIAEAVEEMLNNNTVYSEQTIKTHISSRCCVNSPKNHATKFDDYERIARGIYRISKYKI